VSGPYGDKQLCRSLSQEELDKTFFYSTRKGGDAATRSAVAEAAWAEAQEVCIECPAFLRCREEHWGEENGVWGGTTPPERHAYRLRLREELARMSKGERALVARRLFGMWGSGLRDSPQGIAARTGYAVETVNKLLKEHQARLKPRVRAAPPPPAEPWRPTWTWPKEDPEPRVGDSWIFAHGQVFPAHYTGQDALGSEFRMKFRNTKNVPVIKWLPGSRVDLRRQVTPVILPRGAQNAA
jgi:hypothetical protein